MANQITKKLLLSTGGVQYELTVPEKIYDELGISQERFAELLSRDLYCPTLTAEPASTTLTYTDTDGSTNHFQVGQPCRWLSNGTYRIAICTDATDTATSWYILPDTATIATKSDVQTLQTEVDKKVDKVTGKQLSTEDFTTALKDKLNSLSNYDDTTISNAVSTLRADFDKLVSGDTTEAIKTFNEVIAFLDGVKDTEDLESIITSIETQIAAKQDKLVSGTSIKTVNGVSLLGSGNIDTSYTDATQAAHGLMSVADKKKLDGITEGANPNVQPDWNEATTTSDAYIKNKPALAAVATSGSYNDLTEKPTIPSAVTESTVSGWGFTKNTGTYSKPPTGIPKTDLASDVQTSLGKADTALQSFTETDPVFAASPAHAITAEDITAWNDKMDETPVLNHGTDDTTCSIVPNVFHLWGEVASLNITLATPDDVTMLNEYMIQFTSGATATVLSLPSDIVWISEPTIEASKTYQISIVNNLAVIGGF